MLLVVTSLTPARARNKSLQRDQIKLVTDLVVLDAQVIRKKTGLAVDGLNEEDFEIFEDGVRQDILHFDQDKLPLSVVILLDVSGSVTTLLDQLRRGRSSKKLSIQ